MRAQILQNNTVNNSVDTTIIQEAEKSQEEQIVEGAIQIAKEVIPLAKKGVENRPNPSIPLTF